MNWDSFRENILGFVDDDDEDQEGNEDEEEEEEDDDDADTERESLEQQIADCNTVSLSQAKTLFAKWHDRIEHQQRETAVVAQSKSKKRSNSTVVRELLVDEKLDDGRTMVAVAAAHNDVEFLQQLHTAGASISTQCDPQDRTPLAVAAINNHVEAIQWLVDNGAPMVVLDGDFLTPIWNAVLANSFTAAHWLVDHGGPLMNLYRGRTLVEYLVSIKNAELARKIVTRLPSMLADKPSQLPMLLNSVKDPAFLELTDHMLNSGLIAIDATDKEGNHPLSAACHSGNVSHVRLLLRHSAPIEHATQIGVPMHSAAFSGNCEIIELLLAAGAAAEPAARADSTTPLMIAASAGNADACRLLIKAGADTHAISDENDTMLHYAAAGGSSTVIRMLMPLSADELEAKNLSGETAIGELACFSRDDESQLEPFDDVLKLMLDAGAKFEVVNNDGWTPLCSLFVNNRLSAIQMLVKNGLSIQKNSASASKHTTALPLFIAAALNHVELAKWLIEEQQYDVNSVITSKGSEELVMVCKKDGGAWLELEALVGSTPLHEAVGQGHLAMARILIDAGADMNCAAQNGIVPLEMAVLRGEAACLALLLDRGAVAPLDLLAQTVQNCKFDCMLKLIARGFDFEAPVDDATPLGLAAASDSFYCFIALMLAGAQVDFDDENMRGELTMIAWAYGLGKPEECEVGDKCRDGSDEHVNSASHPGIFKEAQLYLKRFIKFLQSKKLALIDRRATEICIALQSLQLPALMTLAIVDEACAFAPLLPLHLKWRLITAVKHFK